MKKLLELAEKIYSDSLPISNALHELKSYADANGPAGNLIHFLYHFLADADLRAKDEKYSVEQRRQLLLMIETLRNQ